MPTQPISAPLPDMRSDQAVQEQFDEVCMGEPTEFKCSCGGIMHRFDPTRARFLQLQKEMSQPRYKKNHKKWRESQGSKAYIAVALACPLSNPMGFRCASCKSREGFYSMMVHSMFKVEPLPEGAKCMGPRKSILKGVFLPTVERVKVKSR